MHFTLQLFYEHKRECTEQRCYHFDRSTETKLLSVKDAESFLLFLLFDRFRSRYRTVHGRRGVALMFRSLCDTHTNPYTRSHKTEKKTKQRERHHFLLCRVFQLTHAVLFDVVSWVEVL